MANDIKVVKDALIADIVSTEKFDTVYKTLRSAQDVKMSRSASVFLVKAEVNDDNDGEKTLELKYAVQIFVKTSTQKDTHDDNESTVVEKFLEIIETGFPNVAEHSEHINIGELLPMDDDDMGVGLFIVTINYKLT